MGVGVSVLVNNTEVGCFRRGVRICLNLLVVLALWPVKKVKHSSG